MSGEEGFEVDESEGETGGGGVKDLGCYGEGTEFGWHGRRWRQRVRTVDIYVPGKAVLVAFLWVKEVKWNSEASSRLQIRVPTSHQHLPSSNADDVLNSLCQIAVMALRCRKWRS